MFKPMKTLILSGAAVLSLGVAGFALSTIGQAALPAKAKAPMFTTQGAIAGKAFTANLQNMLKKRPVVLYFFPKAFTQGCTIEAHAFASASGDFKKAGAQILGMSSDDIPTLKKFSSEACRDKFPVAQASPSVIKGYDVAFVRNGNDTGLTARISYVIKQDGTIAFVHSGSNPHDHVKMTLAAVKKLKK